MNRKLEDPCLDIQGNEIQVGSKVVFFDAYGNNLYVGKVEKYTERMIKIKSDKLNWPRLVNQYNSDRMLLVLEDEDKKRN